MTDTLPLREQIARLIEETKTANEKAAKEWREGDFAKGLGAITAYERVLALLPSLPDGWVAFVQGVADARNGEGMFWTTPDRDQDQDVIDRMGDAAELLIRAMLSARPTPPTEPPREWDMREATLNQSGCEVLIAFESAARACQFFDDVMEHPVLVPLPAPPKPLETER